MKVGAKALGDNIARVRNVMDALPGEVKLIIDGIYSYDSDTGYAFVTLCRASRSKPSSHPQKHRITRAWRD